MNDNTVDKEKDLVIHEITESDIVVRKIFIVALMLINIAALTICL